MLSCSGLILSCFPDHQDTSWKINFSLSNKTNSQALAQQERQTTQHTKFRVIEESVAEETQPQGEGSPRKWE